MAGDLRAGMARAAAALASTSSSSSGQVISVIRWVISLPLSLIRCSLEQGAFQPFLCISSFALYQAVQLSIIVISNAALSWGSVK